MIPGKQYSPEDYLRMAWRRKWLILVPFVLVSVSTFISVHFLPNRYRSETLILVVPQRVPESYVRSTVTARIEDRLQTISQQILSRQRLERIITDFDLYAEQRKTGLMEDVIEQMRKEIDPQVVRGDAFRVSYISNDPRTVMRVVERLASLFIEENLRDREVLAQSTNQFLESQMEEARHRLIEHEKKLEGYRRQHSDDLPSQLNANLQAQHNAEMQVQALVNSLSTDRDRRLIMQRQLADASALPSGEPVVAPPTSSADGSGLPVGSASEQLAAARAALRAMERRLTPEHPDIVRLKRVIADLERKVDEEAAATAAASQSKAPVVRVVSPAELIRQNRIAELQLELESLTRQIAKKESDEVQLRDTIVAYQSRIQAAPTRDAELADLTRDYDTLQQTYRSLLTRNEDSKLAANLERRQIGEQFKVIDPAHLPEKPFSPDRLRLNELGAALGLGLGLALAGLFEYRDTSLRSESDVLHALDLPVLALVPYLETDEDRRRSRRVRIVYGVTTAFLAVLGLAGLFWKLKA